ncbi:uncharacterized protein [Garra rufa]|uniref:uncharacterized protein n=1 Tax=Garra rufa TaxID=137080 RepID=UPI003CCE637E
MAEARFSQDEFSCPVCLDLLKDPVTIPCGHSYCKSCITGCCDQEDQKRVYRCPQCRQTFDPRPALARNSMVAELVEKLKKTKLPADCYAGDGDVECDVCTGRKYKAVKSCLVCLKSYCQNHLQQHDSWFKGKRHRLTDATERLQEMICQKHEVFCRTDQKCLSVLCMYTHENHDIVSAAAQRTEKQKQLKETQKTFQQRIQQREKDVQQLRETVESHKVSLEKKRSLSQSQFRLSCLVQTIQAEAPQHEKVSTAPAVPFNNGFGAQFSKKEGEWDCDKCCVRNAPTSAVCVACSSAAPSKAKVKPVEELKSPAHVSPPAKGFSFRLSGDSAKNTASADVSSKAKYQIPASSRIGSKNAAMTTSGFGAQAEKKTIQAESPSAPAKGFSFRLSGDSAKNTASADVSSKAKYQIPASSRIGSKNAAMTSSAENPNMKNKTSVAPSSSSFTFSFDSQPAVTGFKANFSSGPTSQFGTSKEEASSEGVKFESSTTKAEKLSSSSCFSFSMPAPVCGFKFGIAKVETKSSDRTIAEFHKEKEKEAVPNYSDQFLITGKPKAFSFQEAKTAQKKDTLLKPFSAGVPYSTEDPLCGKAAVVVLEETTKECKMDRASGAKLVSQSTKTVVPPPKFVFGSDSVQSFGSPSPSKEESCVINLNSKDEETGVSRLKTSGPAVTSQSSIGTPFSTPTNYSSPTLLQTHLPAVFK